MRNRRALWVAATAAVSSLFGSAHFASAGTIATGSVTISLQPVLNTLNSGASGVPSDTWQTSDGKFYIATQDGKVLMNSAGVTSTFFNIGSVASVPFTSNFNGGLLGLTFAPDYATVGAPGYHKVYTYSTDWKTTTQASGGSISQGSQLTGLPDFWPREMYEPGIGTPTVTNWTNPAGLNSQGNVDFDHFNVVREWTAAADGNSIDTSVAPRVLMRIAHGYEGQTSFNGGAIRFGPDNMLYIGIGDGGGNAGQDHQGGIDDGDDGHQNSIGNAQDLTSVYGKVLRIDPVVSHVTGTLSANHQYRIPAGAFYADGPDGNVDEIYAAGFHNPVKMNFDSGVGGTNKLYLADPGFHHREEIDVLQNGNNYGWGFMEGNARLVTSDSQSGDGISGNGTNVRNPSGTYSDFIANTATAPLVDYKARLQYATGDPQHTEDHLIGDGVAVAGGFVYRGSAIPELNGMYVFGDKQYRVVTGFDASNNPLVARDTGRLFYLDPSLASPQIYELGVFGFGPGAQVFGFGQDSSGELYALLDNGNVSKIVVQPNWNVDASGNWSTGANWQHGTPGGIDALVNFGAKITTGRTVTLDSPRTVGSINFDNSSSYTIGGASTLTLDVSSGAAAISVVSGTHTISAPVVLNDDLTIDVYSKLSNAAPDNGLTFGGALSGNGHAITKVGGGNVQFEHVRAGAFSIAGGNVKMRAKATPDDPNGTSVVTSLTVGSASVLDLTNNSMIIDYSGSAGTLVSDTRQNIRNGRLVSTSADATHRLGYGDNAFLQRGNLGGQPVDQTSLLVKFTYAGDSNLDGQVDSADLAQLAQHWLQAADWTGGDLDYNNFVDIRDLYLMATTWQMGVGNPLPGAPLDGPLAAMLTDMAAVPEPAAAGLFLSLACAGIVTRKRHRRATPKPH